MAVREILLLGNEELYRPSRDVSKDELNKAVDVLNDLRDTLLEFRQKYHFGRAIAAPQIAEFWRIIYMDLPERSYEMINPQLEFGNEQFEVWDDCMSFPGLEVKLKRYRKTRIHYLDPQWNQCQLDFTDDLSELIQHEYDHLDGILAVERAIDNRSFRINKLKAATPFPR